MNYRQRPRGKTFTDPVATMSSFGARRKPRIIHTSDDEEGVDKSQTVGGKLDNPLVYSRLADLYKPANTSPLDSSQAQAPVKFSRRPAKSSSLRKSINFDAADDGGETGTSRSNVAATEDEDPDAPVVVRPSFGKSGSAKQKRKSASSRLSFGPGEGAEGDDGKPTTPRKTLGQKALENNAIKKAAAPLQNLPTRFAGGDEDRPRYSKEYLDELQSSTPNTPQNLSSLRISDDDDGDVDMSLDPSELEGATVVQQDTSVATTRSSAPAATVLTEAQIREKKERRARRAIEADFISLDDEDDDGEREPGAGPVSVRFERTTKKPESRLIAEDEDLGEGYDEFVEDGGLSLGRKAERESRRRHRREMAELIQAAEDGSEGESDDSEAERRAAYEAAQRRAGMDGLHRPGEDDGANGDAPNIIPKMKPLPDLDDCLQRMHNLVQGLEDEVTKKRKKIAEMEKEKVEILQREKEVQEILDRAGAQYSSLSGAAAPDVANLPTQSPLRPVPPGLAGDMPVERGLESFGTTPTTRPDIEEMDQ